MWVCQLCGYENSHRRIQCGRVRCTSIVASGESASSTSPRPSALTKTQRPHSDIIVSSSATASSTTALTLARSNESESVHPQRVWLNCLPAKPANHTEPPHFQWLHQLLPQLTLVNLAYCNEQQFDEFDRELSQHPFDYPNHLFLFYRHSTNCQLFDRVVRQLVIPNPADVYLVVFWKADVFPFTLTVERKEFERILGRWCQGEASRLCLICDRESLALNWCEECGQLRCQDCFNKQVSEVIERTGVDVVSAISDLPCPFCRTKLKLFDSKSKVLDGH